MYQLDTVKSSRPLAGIMVLENPTHLYRHLLRNAHLFRDDHTRNYLSLYIRSRFDSNRYETDARQREKLKQGRHGLSLIKRANAGVRDPLLKLLRFSYGRIGPLRYALLKVCPSSSSSSPPPPRESTMFDSTNSAYD